MTEGEDVLGGGDSYLGVLIYLVMKNTTDIIMGLENMSFDVGAREELVRFDQVFQRHQPSSATPNDSDLERHLGHQGGGEKKVWVPSPD